MVFAAIVLLFLGVITPFSQTTTFFNAALLGLLLEKLTEPCSAKKKFFAATLFLLIYGLLLRPWGMYFIIIGFSGIGAGFVLAYFFRQKNKSFSAVFWILIAVNLLVFVTVDGRALSRQLAHAPPKTFQTDMAAYLKTYYLMRQGVSFYQAYARAATTAFKCLPGEIWGWKQPFIFYVWRVLPGGGVSLQYFAGILFFINLFALYKITRKMLPAPFAYLSPVIVLPYFHYPLSEQTLLQVEWWGLSFFIWGAWAFFYKKWLFAGVFFGLALCVRELFLIPIGFLLFTLLLARNFKPFLIILLLIILIFVPQYARHLSQISQYDSLTRLLNNAARKDAAAGWGMVKTTLSYNSWSYAAFSLRPFLILLIADTICFFVQIFRRKNIVNNLTLLSLYLPFFLISLKIGMIDVWHDYWGIYYVPFMLAVAPAAILAVFFPSRRRFPRFFARIL